MANHKQLIPFIKAKEGGLSRAKTDTASKFPAPCTITAKGVTANDWHTNKGITWRTFEAAVKNLNLTDFQKCQMFEQMTDKTWELIYKNLYWNPFFLDNYKSQAFANVVVSWAWGSGSTGAYNQFRKFWANKGINLPSGNTPANRMALMNIFNSVPKSQEREIFNELIEARRNFFVSINQPANLNGWLRRLNDFNEFNQQNLNTAANLPLIGSIGNKDEIITFVGLGSLILGLAMTQTKTK